MRPCSAFSEVSPFRSVLRIPGGRIYQDASTSPRMIRCRPNYEGFSGVLHRPARSTPASAFRLSSSHQAWQWRRSPERGTGWRRDRRIACRHSATRRRLSPRPCRRRPRPRGAGEGQRDAGVARGWFHQNRFGADHAGLFHGLDHGHALLTGRQGHLYRGLRTGRNVGVLTGPGAASVRGQADPIHTLDVRGGNASVEFDLDHVCEAHSTPRARMVKPQPRSVDRTSSSDRQTA